MFGIIKEGELSLYHKKERGHMANRLKTFLLVFILLTAMVSAQVIPNYQLQTPPKVTKISVVYPCCGSNGASGVVYVQAIIDVNGRPSGVAVVKRLTKLSSVFIVEAEKAVRGASFAPGRERGGRAVVSAIVVPVKFVKIK